MKEAQVLIWTWNQGDG